MFAPGKLLGRSQCAGGVVAADQSHFTLFTTIKTLLLMILKDFLKQHMGTMSKSIFFLTLSLPLYHI